jgi:hypothetical protein
LPIQFEGVIHRLVERLEMEAGFDLGPGALVLLRVGEHGFKASHPSLLLGG